MKKAESKPQSRKEAPSTKEVTFNVLKKSTFDTESYFYFTEVRKDEVP